MRSCDAGNFGSPSQDEILIRHMLNRAGGIPMFNDDLARVVTPRTADTSTTLLQMGRWGNEFFDVFYQKFVASSPLVAEKFEAVPARHAMRRQRMGGAR